MNKYLEQNIQQTCNGDCDGLGYICEGIYIYIEGQVKMWPCGAKSQLKLACRKKYSGQIMAPSTNYLVQEFHRKVWLKP